MESDEDSSDDEDDGSVELVSEDDFSLQELESVAQALAERGGGARRAKRART